MSKILVCQHVGYEILGTLNPLLKQQGFRIRYVNFHRYPDLQTSLDGYQGLVILGGPMNLDQTDEYQHLAHEIELIKDAIERDIPTLGICLGAQLIAAALGAPVSRNPCKEIGWYDVTLTDAGRQDPVFRHFRTTEKLFQWHGDSFAIPEGAVHLAVSEDCPHQAFRYGDKVYALQFHLEVDQAMIEHWLQVPRHVAELAALAGKIDPEQIRRETELYVDGLKQLSEQTFGEFVGLIGGKKKYQSLPSR